MEYQKRSHNFIKSILLIIQIYPLLEFALATILHIFFIQNR